jgi:hypothetical protein
MRKRKLRWWMVPVGIILVLVVTGVGLMANSEYQYNRLLDEASKLGMAVRAEDFKKYAVADADNAAPAYQQAIHRLGLMPKEDVALLRSYAPGITEKEYSQSTAANYKGPDPGTAARSARLKWGGLFAEIDKATQKPHLDFKRQWEKAATIAFPELGLLKTICQALAADAAILLEDGNTPAALKRIDQARTMALHMREEPTLIAQLVAAAFEARTDVTALKMAASQPQNEVLMEGLGQYFSEPPVTPDFERAMGAESFFLTALLDEVARDPKAMGVMQQDTDLLWKSRALKIKWLRRSAQATALTGYIDFYKVLKKDPDDWRGIEKALQAFDVKLHSDTSLSGQLAQAFTPVFAQIGETCRKGHNRRRLARLTLQLLAAKQRTGEFPKSLSKGGDNSDLHSGKPFVYRRTSDGFILYGTDVDGSDDGGTLLKDFGVLVQGRTLQFGRR